MTTGGAPPRLQVAVPGLARYPLKSLSFHRGPSRPCGLQPEREVPHLARATGISSPPTVARRRWLCRGRLPGVVDLSVDRFSCAPEHPHDVLDGLRSFKNGAVAPGMRPVFLSSGQGRESLVLGVAEAGVACRDDPPLLRVKRIDLQRSTGRWVVNGRNRSSAA